MTQKKIRPNCNLPLKDADLHSEEGGVEVLGEYLRFLSTHEGQHKSVRPSLVAGSCQLMATGPRHDSQENDLQNMNFYLITGDSRGGHWSRKIVKQILMASNTEQSGQLLATGHSGHFGNRLGRLPRAGCFCLLGRLHTFSKLFPR